MIEAPEFMHNKEWYTYDPDTDTYTLTDKAPERVKPSFDYWMKHRHDEYDWLFGATQEELSAFCERESERMRKLIKEEAEKKARLVEEKAKRDAEKAKRRAEYEARCAAKRARMAALQDNATQSTDQTAK